MYQDKMGEDISLDLIISTIEKERKTLTADKLPSTKEERYWQEEVSHEETVCDGDWEGYDGGGPACKWVWIEHEYTTKVVDEEAGWRTRIVPDHRTDKEKREEARSKLQRIYNLSEWYSARYLTGKALGEDVGAKLEEWIMKLRSKLYATKTGKGHYEDEIEIYYPGSRYGTYDVEHERKTGRKIWVDGPRIPDEEKINAAKEDLRFMYDNLENKDHRAKVGEALGYSKLRIWLHEWWRGRNGK